MSACVPSLALLVVASVSVAIRVAGFLRLYGCLRFRCLVSVSVVTGDRVSEALRMPAFPTLYGPVSPWLNGWPAFLRRYGLPAFPLLYDDVALALCDVCSTSVHVLRAMR